MSSSETIRQFLVNMGEPPLGVWPGAADERDTRDERDGRDQRDNVHKGGRPVRVWMPTAFAPNG